MKQKITQRISNKVFSNKGVERPYHEFWNWFCQNEKSFHNVVKGQGNIEKNFFDKLSPKLNELKEDFFFVTGMLDDDSAELIVTADGTIKNIVFVEELIDAAPAIEGWKFTALKPPLDIKAFLLTWQAIIQR